MQNKEEMAKQVAAEKELQQLQTSDATAAFAGLVDAQGVQDAAEQRGSSDDKPVMLA